MRRGSSRLVDHSLRSTGSTMAPRPRTLVGALKRREDLMDLSKRTVLVVVIVIVGGGTSGIGREPARRFAAAGGTVAVGGRSRQARAELAAEGFGTCWAPSGSSTLSPPPGATRRRRFRHRHLRHRFPALPSHAHLRRVEGRGTRLLRGTARTARRHRCRVVELVRPAVATAGQGKVNPHALPLDGFATEVWDCSRRTPSPVKSSNLRRPRRTTLPGPGPAPRPLRATPAGGHRAACRLRPWRAQRPKPSAADDSSDPATEAQRPSDRSPATERLKRSD